MDIKTSSSFSTSMTGFECAWSGIFTSLQIGTATSTAYRVSLMLDTIAACISATLSGPPEFCEKEAPLSICASITVLVPISWLATTSREYLLSPVHSSYLS